RRIERVSVPVDKLLELHTDGPESLRLSRRRPFSPQPSAMIQKRLVDHDREVRGEAGSVLEFSDDGVIVVTQLQEDVRREVLRVVVADAMPPADRESDLADDWKVPFENLFCVLVGLAAMRALRIGSRCFPTPCLHRRSGSRVMAPAALFV